jgi:hypothetical protein
MQPFSIPHGVEHARHALVQVSEQTVAVPGAAADLSSFGETEGGGAEGFAGDGHATGGAEGGGALAIAPCSTFTRSFA